MIGFISCDQPTGSPKTEVENESGEDTGKDSNKNEENKTPINNFKDKTFIGMIDEGDDEEFFSYIIFTSDTECKVMFSEVLAQATYTVTDDVATISGTGDFAQIQLSTTQLTNGEFSITVKPEVSGEEEDIIVNYAVGTLWTISYPSEDFSIKWPEQLLNSAIEKYGFEDADYTKDDTTKTVTLKDSGWDKVMSAMGGGGSEEDSDEDPNKNPEENGTPINNFKDKTFIGMIDEGDDEEFVSYIIFTSDTECEVMFFEESVQATYTVTDDVATISGTGDFAQIQLSTTQLTNGEFSITVTPDVSGEEEDIIINYAVGTLWTISYPSEEFTIIWPEQLLASAIEKYGFEDADYTEDDETKTITLTDSGWEKVKSAMGGGSGEDSSEDSGEIYYYMYNGELAGGKNTLEDFYYEVELYGLVESEDYTIDYENKQINFTESGYNKIN